jgi:dTDP-4-dehydrorhamnose 3,5-epimerase
LSETADVLYKCTAFYDPDDEYGILWSDPAIGIEWPVAKPVLSPKDSQYPQLKDITDSLLPS